MEPAPRYAIYFVPAPQSKLYRYGSSILGYDCYTGAPVDFPQEFGAGAVNWNELTAAPRYGFHATLKAPFHLSPSCTERQLVNALQNFAGLGHAIRKFAPTVRLISGFFAVVPLEAETPLDALATSCTTLFDAYRAPMSPRERARRVALGLNRTQIQNLDRWGHPYVLSEFRFHMTLTGAVPPSRRKAIVEALLDGFHRMGVESSIAIDRLALVKQETPDAAFRLVSEFEAQHRITGRPRSRTARREPSRSRVGAAAIQPIIAVGRLGARSRPGNRMEIENRNWGEDMSDAAATSTAGPTVGQIYKVALASIVGSVIEQYDFLVTGVIAATVWGGIFFKLPGLAAVAAAISVYGLGIIIRPVGAYIFGNIADVYGRKDAMVYALVLMGVATLAIGLTPTYDSIGVIAPVLLIVFRLLQGISFGAEFGTASTWVVEQAARSKYRAFWGAWVGFAIPIGLLLGFGSVIFVKSLMTPEDFTSWGWRIFFVVGFLVAIVGLIIRTRTMDSFVFEQHKAQIAILKYPASQVWREMPWTILRTSLVNAMFGGAFFLYFVFGTGYMKAVGFPGNQPEEIGLIAAAFMLVFMIIGSFLADYINRRTILLTAAVVLLIFALPYFYLVNTGSFLLATIAEIIGFGFVFGFGYGAIPTFYTENFPTRYRASGASAAYQIAQVYGGGLIPIVAGQILRAYGVHDAYLYIGLLVMCYAVAAMVAIIRTPETKGANLEN